MPTYDSSCFDKSKLAFDPTGYQCVAFPLHHRLFELLKGYIASHVIEDFGSGFRMDVLRSKRTDEEEENLLEDTQYGRIVVKIGFGQYKFRTSDEDAYAVYQHIGEPVGSDCGPDILQNILVFTKSLPNFGRFLSNLLDLSEKPDEGKFVCFTWLIRHQYWREEVRVNNRPIASVVLPTAMKTRLVSDVEKFLSPKTKDFYLRNGIPYRRSYLFHGVPGTGKTSMVQALAGHFRRNVCFLMPTHPEMTDDNLREAIQSIPDNSIVVLEDIDALFTKNRQNKSNKSALTFSGLLNALDGIGSPHGQIFVLTTNLRDNLDHALIRNGRVDMHLEFTYATTEQMELMWSNFYPDAKQLSAAFAAAVEKELHAKSLQITTSTLQHFFITQMESTPEQALEAVPSIVAEVLQNSSTSMLQAAKNKTPNGNGTTKGTAATAIETGGSEEKKKNTKPGKKKRDKERRRREREEKGFDGSSKEGDSDLTKEEFVVIGTKIPTPGNTITTETENGGATTTSEGEKVGGESGEKKNRRNRDRKNRNRKNSEGNEGSNDTNKDQKEAVMVEVVPTTEAPITISTGNPDGEVVAKEGINTTPLPKRDRRNNKNRTQSTEGTPTSTTPAQTIVNVEDVEKEL